jgi:outer membrane protein assembly factor BamB
MGDRGVRRYRSAPDPRVLFPWLLALVLPLGLVNVALLRALLEDGDVALAAPARAAPARAAEKAPQKPSAAPRRIAPAPEEGLWTFRGNARRSLTGVGSVPRRSPRIVWRYPRTGGMCSRSTDEAGTTTWCGIGWTGQPNVIPRPNGKVEVRFGAFDRRYHFLDATTGREVRPSLLTGDLAKGSATSDPDGFPLYYAGSRDNALRIVALDRGRPTVLWRLDAYVGERVIWNDDWDGAPLVVDGHLLVGGENSWFYVVRLNRGYTRGKVRVRPRVVARVPSWDGRLLAARTDHAFSIESSVAYDRGIAYFANSAGLVQGWDVRPTLRHGKPPRRVFRFWMGDDTDASVVIDESGYLYVASELERFTERARRVGQLVKLDPRHPRAPLVWSVQLRGVGRGGKAGSWSTPAVVGDAVYIATNEGGVVAVDRRTGHVRWRLPLPGPTWGSPVVVDGVLIEGDCRGNLRAFDVSGRRPRALWSIRLGGCIESTPAVWRGRIYVGTRGGAMYALAGARS